MRVLDDVGRVDMDGARRVGPLEVVVYRIRLELDAAGEVNWTVLHESARGVLHQPEVRGKLLSAERHLRARASLRDQPVAAAEEAGQHRVRLEQLIEEFCRLLLVAECVFDLLLPTSSVELPETRMILQDLDET